MHVRLCCFATCNHVPVCFCLFVSPPSPSAASQILTDWQDKKGDKRFLKLGKDPDPAASSRHKPKKQKLDGKGGHTPGPGPGRPKSKNLQPKVQEYEFTDDPQDIPRTPKNDAPNRSATTATLGVAQFLLFDAQIISDLYF